mgnify:CR=1 FL=1
MNCTIIGGGIQGVSTGILLEYLGHETTIVSEAFAYLDGPDIPTVATDYAAASIYPVQIASEYTEDELIRRAESTFKPFYDAEEVPVRKHRHFYIYETQHINSLQTGMGCKRFKSIKEYFRYRAGMKFVGGTHLRNSLLKFPDTIRRYSGRINGSEEH